MIAVHAPTCTYTLLMAIDENEDRAVAAARAAASLPDDEEELTLLYCVTDNPGDDSETRVHPVREASVFFEERGIHHGIAEISGAPQRNSSTRRTRGRLLSSRRPAADRPPVRYSSEA